MKPTEFKESSYWFIGQLGLHILHLVVFKTFIDASDNAWVWNLWLYVIPLIFIGINAFSFRKQRQIKKRISELTPGARIWFSTIEIFSVGMILLWIASLGFLLFMQFFLKDVF